MSISQIRLLSIWYCLMFIMKLQNAAVANVGYYHHADDIRLFWTLHKYMISIFNKTAPLYKKSEIIRAICRLFHTAYNTQTGDNVVDCFGAGENGGGNQSDVGEIITRTEDQVCQFQISSLGTNCTTEKKYGFEEGRPCVLLKINRVCIKHAHMYDRNF